jgi:hypothetical protein
MVMTEKASMATNPPVVDKSRIQTVVGLSTKYVPSVPLQSESNVNDIVQSDSFAALGRFRALFRPVRLRPIAATRAAR